MVNAKVFGFLILFLVLVQLASAATCASKSYTSSCYNCGFDKDGKMNQACYEGYQNRGVACLFAAYPIESSLYKLGACPAIDVCVDRLNTCKALYSSNNDKLDCASESLNHCFVRGDTCVVAAVKNCSGTPPGDISDLAPPAAWCDGMFFFVSLFVGIGFVSRKK